MFSSLFQPRLKTAALCPDGMDMHCHLLWGVDDGAHTLQDSRDIIALLKARGFKGAYCTPHIISRYPSNTPASLKTRFRELLESLQDPEFDLRLAAEYMLDENFERMITEEEPLSHDGIHLLVELPQFRLPNAWMDMIQLVQDRGLVPVLAHPERYGKIISPEELASLASRGIRFQGNIGSLFGLYGKSCQATARKFHKENLYLWWGTDAHNTNMLKKIRL